MDNRNVSLAELCHEVKSLCTKILEKSGFLLSVDNASAHTIRSEILSINAVMSMVEAVFTKEIPIKNSPFNVLSVQSDSLYGCIENSRNYLETASQSTVPDAKGSDLANILCQVPYLIPSATLFRSVISEIREYRATISEGLKYAIARASPAPKEGTQRTARSTIQGELSVQENGPAILRPQETWEDKFQSILDGNPDSGAINLVNLQNQLFARLWMNLPRRIFALGPQISPKICESIYRIDRKLLDTINRRFASRYTMAFVGMQSSGKSTFLNEFIGKNLLPSHGNPTTTYPCRIRHVTGKVIPELHLSKTLETGLTCLRKFDWPKKYAGYMSEPPTWMGDDLPTKVEAKTLVGAWEISRDVTQDNLSRFMDPSFAIPQLVRGEDEIREWLQAINDLTSLCQSFVLPFEAFVFEDWALIECEFLKVPLAPTEGFCEVVDIPGVDNEQTWDDVIQEVIRHANAVVAIVSLHGFNPNSWVAPAKLISQTTNLSVAAIIMTKSDFAQDNDSSLTSDQILEKGFWKAKKSSHVKLGVLSRCSVIGSRGARAVLDLIDQEGTKPSFEIFSKMPYTGFLMGQSPTGARSLYKGWTLDELIAECNERIRDANVSGTIEELQGIINNGLGRQLVAEIVGIEEELKTLQDLIASEGLERRVPPEPVTQDSGAILEKWTSLQTNLQGEIDSIISAGSLLSQSGSAATSAVNSATRDLVRQGANSRTVDFGDIEALHDLISSIQKDFWTRYSVVSKDAMHHILERSRNSINRALSGMNQSIKTLELFPYQLVQTPWPAEPVVNPSALTPTLTENEVVRKERRSLQGRQAFNMWRERVQHMLVSYSRMEGDQPSSFQNHLISLITIITFPIRYILGVQHTLFVLDLDHLQRSLQENGERHWKESLLPAFRQEIEAENDPVWKAVHIAIGLALAKAGDGSNGSTSNSLEPPESLAMPSEPLSSIQEIIAVNLGFIRILSSRLGPYISHPVEPSN